MPEFLGPSPEQEQPTPQQLNARLNALFDLIPKNKADFDFDAYCAADEATQARMDEEYIMGGEETDRRRANSEYTNALWQQTVGLVARATITVYFRERILHQFGRAI